jgi:hypothetical protein
MQCRQTNYVHLLAYFPSYAAYGIPDRLSVVPTAEHTFTVSAV